MKFQMTGLIHITSHSLTMCVSTGQENGKSRLQQAQEGVEEVKVIMLDNLNKADERSGKLEDLEGRADELLEKVSNLGSAVQVEKHHYFESHVLL